MPAVAGSTVLFDWDLSELTKRADLIVLAKVVSRQSFIAENTIMTRTHLVVERTLMGSDVKEFELLQLGGQVGARIVDVPGDAELVLGQTYLLYTAHPAGQPYRTLVGMGLGAHRLSGDVLTQDVNVPLMDPTGALLPAPGARTFRLSEVLRVIRESRR